MVDFYNTKIISIANQKGGVGKTTSSVNIAAYLAISEAPTLLVDMDASDTCYIAWGQSGGSNTADPFDSTQFSIHLVA